MKAITIFQSLRQKEFAKLYGAQTISLLGDAFSWVGIALLAFEFGGENSTVILSTALTLRVTAFIIFAPYAGVLADRINRKRILVLADVARMVLVGLLALVSAEWQLYVLIFLLNVCSAFFTPAFKASIPQTLKNKENSAPAITLSNATYQLLAIMGPGLAGVTAAWLGAKEIFVADSVSYLISALFVLAIGRHVFTTGMKEKTKTGLSNWREIFTGTKILFADAVIRFALFIELSVAIAGANVLVNTVSYVKGTLMQGDKEYGWVMSALGVGAVLGAFGSALIDKSKSRSRSLILGSVVIGLSLLFADQASLFLLIGLWAVAGFGQNLAEMPSQILIAERIPADEQGRVYGAHFAWSHLWWAISYPLAGMLGHYFKGHTFVIAGIIGSGILLVILFIHYGLKNKKMRSIIIISLVLFFSDISKMSAQNIEGILNEIEKNNRSIQSDKAYGEARNAEFRTGLTPDDPQAGYEYLIGSPAGAGNQKDFSITQRLDFPTTYQRKKELSVKQIAKTGLEQQVHRQDILLEASLVILQIIYFNKKLAELNKRLAATRQLVTDYQKKADKGDVIILDVNKAKIELYNIQNDVALTDNEKQIAQTKLSELNGGKMIEIVDTSYPPLPVISDFEKLDSIIEANDPTLKVYEQEIRIRQQHVEVQKALNLPKMEIGYHSQSILGQSYKGAHAGLTIPLWENRNRLTATRLNLHHSESISHTHILEHRFENKALYDRLAVRKKAMEQYGSLLLSLNNEYLLNKALRLGQITVIQYFSDESYYFSAYDKYLQMELEYQQAIARLYKFRL